MKFAILAILICTCQIAGAQSLIRSLPKPTAEASPRRMALSIGIPAQDTTVYQGFRFTGPTVLYALPQSTAFTGVGLSYEHDTYKTATGKFYTDWSVAIQGFAGGQFAPSSISGVTAVGFTVSFFNKILTVGMLYNLTTQKAMAGVGPGVATNN